jgi:hypothetical protein
MSDCFRDWLTDQLLDAGNCALRCPAASGMLALCNSATGIADIFHNIADGCLRSVIAVYDRPTFAQSCCCNRIGNAVSAKIN